MVLLGGDKREIEARRCLIVSFLNNLEARLSARVNMANGDGNRRKLNLHRDAWTLASRDQSLEKKRKENPII